MAGNLFISNSSLISDIPSDNRKKIDSNEMQYI